MKSISFVIAALLALSPVGLSAAHAQSTVRHCPPGLANKNPPCVPPGQVGKTYHIGERYGDDGYWDEGYRKRYDLPQLPRGESYYRIGDSVLRVDDETRLVLELIEVLAGLAD
jgi:hypothetical protein